MGIVMDSISSGFGIGAPSRAGTGEPGPSRVWGSPGGDSGAWRRPGPARRLAGATGAIIWAVGAASAAASPQPGLVQVGRTVAQDQGAWVVDYRLRHTGPTGIVVTPEEIAVKVEGWVSNSRVATHAVARWSSLAVPHGPEFSATGEVIAAVDEAHRCREKLTVAVWSEDQEPCRPGACARHEAAGAKEATGSGTAAPAWAAAGSGTSSGRESGWAGTAAGLPLSLAPGALVHVRLRLEHQHVLYGDYDPLLAIRAVELTLGGSTVRDLVPLDREQYLAQPKFTWPEPPEERRDTRQSISGPDSLHLEAHVPGHHYYRFPDRPVRYGTKMRLRFWYLVAAGTEGECRVRIAQYKDTPTSWRMLPGGGFERCLKTVGRWTQVEHVFSTESEATTLALDFRIAGDTDVGEMWIDDVSLEPVGCNGHGGP
jgi:hypothetical protein